MELKMRDKLLRKCQSQLTSALATTISRPNQRRHLLIPRRQSNLLLLYNAILYFVVKESPDKVSMGTVEKLTLENVYRLWHFISGGTEPEIHMVVIYIPNCNVHFKKYHCSTRVNRIYHYETCC